MRTVQTLIDEAADMCKGDAALGRRIGKTRAQVCDMRASRVAVTPETVALLCDVLELPGEECQRLAAQAVIDNPKNAERQGTLRRAFFGCLALGAVACGLLTTATTDAMASTAAAIKWTVYTLSAMLRSGTDRGRQAPRA